MAISMNHSTSQMQSGLSAYNFIKIPTPPGSTINTTYSIGAYPTFILIKPDKQIVEKDIWPISNTILRTAVTNAGGVPQSCATSLEENADNSSIFTVYPNPASGYINFNSDGLTDAIYEIYNIIGDKLLSGKTTNNGINRLNISALSEGQYFIKVLSNKGLTSVQKFIVLKQ